MMAAGPRKGRVVATWDLWGDGCGLRYVLLLNTLNHYPAIIVSSEGGRLSDRRRRVVVCVGLSHFVVVTLVSSCLLAWYSLYSLLV